MWRPYEKADAMLRPCKQMCATIHGVIYMKFVYNILLIALSVFPF